jgi:hypothetical protein
MIALIIKNVQIKDVNWPIANRSIVQSIWDIFGYLGCTIIQFHSSPIPRLHNTMNPSPRNQQPATSNQQLKPNLNHDRLQTSPIMHYFCGFLGKVP